jgi:hypothetical protein
VSHRAVTLDVRMRGTQLGRRDCGIDIEAFHQGPFAMLSQRRTPIDFLEWRNGGL